MAKTLLEECNADPDCVDFEGWTPLHAAALWGHKEAAALLLKYGADPHIKNYSVSVNYFGLVITLFKAECRLTYCKIWASISSGYTLSVVIISL